MENNNSFENVCYNINELSLHGVASGNVDNEVVLCLHGWLDNAASFLPLLPLLKNKRVIAIDWPGHGLSSHRSLDAHYHFIDWVYDLLQLFEHNKWTNIHVVAHSMGAMVASAFVAAFPEKVKSLTLLDSIGFLNTKADKTSITLRDGMLSRLSGQTKKKSIHASIESAINARMLVSDLTYPLAALITNRGLVRENSGYVWRSDSRLRNKSPYRLTLEQAQQFIKDISIPVQLIYGDKGMALVNTGLKIFAPLFTQLTIHELNGGHHIHMEKPEETANFINHFIC